MTTGAGQPPTSDDGQHDETTSLSARRTSRLPAPNAPLPPPVAPDRGEAHAAVATSGTLDDRHAEGRPTQLARPVPQRSARHRPPAAAALLLGGSGAFLLLVVAAAALGAVVGKHDSTAEPTDPGRPQSTSSRAERQEPERHGDPARNPVYRTGRMASVECRADLRSAAPEPYEKFVRESTTCLNRAWQAQLRKRGITHTPPDLVISHTAEPTSPCRSSVEGYVPVAFYCPTNRTVYYSLPSAKRAVLPKDREYLISTSAHEYAHHIQQMTGITGAYYTRYNKVYPRNVDGYTRLTRRLELQAQCFAGVFTGSNARTMRIERAAMAETADRTGDDALDGAGDDPSLRVHGNFASNHRWLIRYGWDHRAPDTCNTWAAAAATVA
ncbi:MAG: hypothetical protein GEV07_10540 [Streptosporangiales bacterium]|nr:hypothetical protein [Streptosporangiales bacterium]